jgi:hypothetical protein
MINKLYGIVEKYARFGRLYFDRKKGGLVDE